MLLELLEHALQPLLEVAAVLGAGQQRPHVERVDVGVAQHIGHLALRDAPGQAFGNCRLAHAGLAHEERIVLAPPAQDLDHALDLGLTADQRVDAAIARQLVQVLRELVEWRCLGVGRLFLLAFAAAVVARLGGLRRVVLLDAMGDEVDHVQPRHTLLVQVIHRVRILLAKGRDQHIGARHFLLAAAGGLHVHDGALDHALESQRRLGVDLVVATDRGCVLLDEGRQALPQVFDVGRTGAQHFGRRRVVQQGQQQMLDGDEFVTLLARFDERHVQTDFQLLRNHAASIMHCNGCPACLAAACTSSTLVAAMSLL